MAATWPSRCAEMLLQGSSPVLMSTCMCSQLVRPTYLSKFAAPLGTYGQGSTLMHRALMAP